MITNQKNIWFTLLVIWLLVIVLLSTSCMGTKKTTDKNHSQTTNTTATVKKDSSKVVETNQEIKDRIVINVPQSSDENTTKLLDAILKNLNTSKTSGSNSYSSTYDAETRQLVIDFIIAQTQTKQTKTNTSEATTKTFEEKTDEYISKKVTAIPWWAWLIAGIWFLPQILTRVHLIASPIQSFFKPTSKFNS